MSILGGRVLIGTIPIIPIPADAIQDETGGYITDENGDFITDGTQG